MYIINRDNKQSKKIEAITFSSLGLKERDDLQEWIVKEPTILGEELLIIQKSSVAFRIPTKGWICLPLIAKATL